MLLGYVVSQKGYKLFDIESKTIFISRDVTFCEKEFPFQTNSIDSTTAQDPLFHVSHSPVDDCELTPCVVINNAPPLSNHTGHDGSQSDPNNTTTTSEDADPIFDTSPRNQLPQVP